MVLTQVFTAWAALESTVFFIQNENECVAASSIRPVSAGKQGDQVFQQTIPQESPGLTLGSALSPPAP